MKDEAYRALAILGMFLRFVGSWGGIKVQPLSSMGMGGREVSMTPLQPSILHGLGTPLLGTVGQREGRMQRENRFERGTGRALQVAFMLSQVSDTVGGWVTPLETSTWTACLKSKVALNGSLQRGALLKALP